LNSGRCAGFEGKLIVIDECSMVDAELGRDLMSSIAPLRGAGRSRALPPIQGGASSRTRSPICDADRVHRQAQNDPIVRMSMEYREGRELESAAQARAKWCRVASSIGARDARKTRSWSAATTRERAYNMRMRQKKSIEERCRSPATSWCACATTARKACSMAGYGG